jgi:hypothetical protein
MNNKINPFLWLFVLFSSAHFKIYNGYESKENKGFKRVLYEKIHLFQTDVYKWIHNCWFVYPYENTSILKEIQMSKSCTFLGNDYQWSRSDIIEKVKKQSSFGFTSSGECHRISKKNC